MLNQPGKQTVRLNPQTTQKGQPGKPGAQQATLQRVSSHELLQGSREIIITHEGQEYRLRLTSNSKLILTK